METPWQLVTEEARMSIGDVRARLKNTARRTLVYFLFALVLALGGGYGIYRYWMVAHLTPFQRFYFGQYWDSSYKSYLRHTKSHYTILARTIADPRTQEDMTLGLTNSQIEAEVDDEGHLSLDQNGDPTFIIKDCVNGADPKSVLLCDSRFTDSQAYSLFRASI